jgi:hypothetical protein
MSLWTVADAKGESWLVIEITKQARKVHCLLDTGAELRHSLNAFQSFISVSLQGRDL